MIALGILFVYIVILLIIFVFVVLALLYKKIRRKASKWNKLDTVPDIMAEADYVLIDSDILMKSDKVEFLLELRRKGVPLAFLSPIYYNYMLNATGFAYNPIDLTLKGVDVIDYSTSATDYIDIYMDFISEKSNHDKILIISENMDMKNKINDYNNNSQSAFKVFITQLRKKT